MITPLHHAIKNALHFLVRSRRSNVVAYATLAEIRDYVLKDPAYDAASYEDCLEDVLSLSDIFYRYQDSIQLVDMRNSLEFHKKYQEPKESDYNRLRDLVILEMQRYTYQSTFALDYLTERIGAIPALEIEEYGIERVFYRLFREGVILKNTNHAGGYILAEEYQDPTAPTARLIQDKDVLKYALAFYDGLRGALCLLQNQSSESYVEFSAFPLPMFSKHLDKIGLRHEMRTIPDTQFVWFRIYPKVST